MASHEIRLIKKTINKVIREKKRFPNLQEMCNITSMNPEQTLKYMQALEEDGYLVRNGGWYKFPDAKPIIPTARLEQMKEEPVQAEIETPVEMPVEPIPAPVPEAKIEPPREVILIDKPISKPRLKSPGRPKKLKESATLYGMPIYIIQAIMGIVGIGAAIISVYYTTVWLIEFLPLIFALLLSGIMIGFSIAAFETVILFLSGTITKSKAVKISISIGFIALWLIVSAFSITSTIAGQVDRYSKNFNEQSKQETNIYKASWDVLQERKNDVKIRISEYHKQIKNYNDILSGMNNLDSRTSNENIWKETQWRVNKAQAELNKLLNEMENIRNEEKDLLKKIKDNKISFTSNKKIENNLNFYEWLSKILNIKENFVQFWLSLFPAVFVDVIAPTAIAISLFLRKRT